MEIKKVNLQDITPYENNPRKNDDAVAAVVASIKEFGFKVPIVIDSNGVIVAGHTRYKAAKKLDLKEIPCIVADDLTEDQIKAFRLADNKVGEIAAWDFELLDEELLGITDINMSDFGFTIDALGTDVEVVEDEFNGELPENPKSKLGDIYKLGRHRLMCGDSTDINCVETLMNGNKADIFITDPPYNVDYTGKTKDNLKIQNDKMDDSSFRDFLKNAFYCADVVMKQGAVFLYLACRF